VSYVYFIRALPDGPVKIGYTEFDPSKRRSELQTGCPWPIKVIGAIVGDRRKEMEMHAALSVWRLSGEWFAPNDAVMAAVFAALKYGEQILIEEPSPAPCEEDTRNEVAALLIALGGTSAVRRLTGASPNAISNWRVMGKLPWRFRNVLTSAASERGISIPETVWGTRWQERAA
jgi:hypothetical protein